MVEFKYLYIFSRDHIDSEEDKHTDWLVEVKILGKDKDTPKDQVYLWLYIRDSSTDRLNFVEMEQDYRSFTEGDLIMIDAGCVFNTDGETFIFDNTDKGPDEQVNEFIKDFEEGLRSRSD
jgi:hypothetical protein